MSSSLGIIGAGKLGVALARVAVNAGFDVMVAATVRENTELILSVMAPGARVGSVSEVAAFAPCIVLALPLNRFHELPADSFDGKVVIDAINFWEPVDGGIERFGVGPAETSSLVQAHFGGAVVVKSLNQLGYHDVEDGARPKGAPDRLGVAVAGEASAAAVVAALVDQLGFDPVIMGTLADGRLLGPGGAGFGATLSARQLREQLENQRTTD